MAGRPGQRLHDSEQARLAGGPGRLGCHLRGRCKGRDHAAGGMEVMQAPGASLGETQLRGSGTHESGHPARLNGRSILKRHSRLKLPKSSSGFCTLSVQSSDTSIVDSRESCQNFCFNYGTLQHQPARLVRKYRGYLPYKYILTRLGRSFWLVGIHIVLVADSAPTSFLVLW